MTSVKRRSAVQKKINGDIGKQQIYHLSVTIVIRFFVKIIDYQNNITVMGYQKIRKES